MSFSSWQRERAVELAKQGHRGRAGWLALIERGAASGLSVEAFCRQEGVNRSCFYRWRTRLASESESGSAPKSGVVRARLPAARPAVQSQSPFVDLGSLGKGAGNGRFELRLDLGGGLVLTLARG